MMIEITANAEAMQGSRDLNPGNISQFPLINTLVEIYCGIDANRSFRNEDISRLISCGLDYTLANSQWRSHCLFELHEHLRRVQNSIVEQIAKIVAGRYKVVASQSFAYGKLDTGAALNGYKSDLDLLVSDADLNCLKSDLTAAGHVRRVLDAESGLPIDLDETDKVDVVPGKAMVGTFLIPLNIQSFDIKTQQRIRVLAGVHQPLNIDKRGEAYLLYGIDAISFYGSEPVDLARCSLNADCSLPIQDTTYNAVVAIRRLYSVVSEGALKPNLLFLICRMLKNSRLDQIECQLDGVHREFFRSFVWYHQVIISSEVPFITSLSTLNELEMAHVLTFSELYSSLTEYIESHNG